MLKIQILSSEDPLLESVRAVLKVNEETFAKTLSSGEEYCYGVALQKEKIIAVCSLHVQYKFTRFLGQCYHAKLLRSTGVQSEKALWDGICKRLSCYKVIGTDFSHERTKQEQILMVYDVSASPHL